MNTQLQRAQAMPLAVPGNDLDAYIRAVNAVPVLSAEEERVLAERLYFQEDLDAARNLVLAHLRFVVHIARSYTGYGLPLGDLIQEGNVGLMKAVKRFDPAKGVRLVSFAVHWIKAEIHEYVIRNWRIVKVATTKAQRKLFFNLRGQKKRLGRLTPEEAARVADDLGVTPEQVKEMEGRLGAYDASFDGPINDDEDNTIPSPAAYLHSDNSDPAELLAEQDDQDRNSRKLGSALLALDDRSRDILERRWLADSKSTLQELADEYGVSAERIRQLENNAIKKLRNAIAA
ncbi:RNA polymerase sigma factor RpoH [Alloalcanivorax xenomutans]|jgi:RNA polymerase sigma-32 factor|uniref:RNA polymerase sigma factor RpoH n=1 Tax=Alloalcanivorax xenomutans TaxID=1094342 RepID=A0A9Q3W8P1_9GAMM|nr:RNA polymerase sigma factor RpoH [Alloalcanivorax xenomutans]ERS10801.1 RNA polymerase factor sigma-32 [Alcanivorax sp. PN-3]KYZ86981.1 RNA polymerase factor sigma-32 [Alcanivorax sp. KX64203]MBA4722682.1 RNA polymerase sigma factor RpoH [Alcanivorax sp.]ARB44182.1 RNA polymerase factor sigma-32 [Alloalcanivorax xenomutans]MCE7511119.1 RNA polymerase sigma factor RpoH [Alloalcanivorax xenomutans]|tara:strand:- start:271 stop:1134 length:864 start_codon:yes stop_codon:yes gene_type:complete